MGKRVKSRSMLWRAVYGCCLKPSCLNLSSCLKSSLRRIVASGDILRDAAVWGSGPSGAAELRVGGVAFAGSVAGRWTGAESGGGVSPVAGCSRHVRKNRQRISLFGEIRCPVCVAMPAPPVRHRGCYGRITSWSSPCRRDGRRSRNATWHSPRRRRTVRLPRPGRPS